MNHTAIRTNRGRLFAFAAGVLLLLSACSPLGPLPQPLPTAAPATPPPAIPTALPAPTATPPLVPDTGWASVVPGLEQRTLRILRDSGELIETVTILRLETGRFGMQVLYAPGAPHTVQEWAAGSGALLTINAGYFTPEYQATGLLIADGVAHGASYGEFAGMLSAGPAGIQLQWLGQDPYDPTAPLHAAIQSFPVLVKPGGLLGYPDEDGTPGRRTVVALDRSGRLLVIVCANGTFTLHRLAVYLLESDLEIDIALNLDGGTSTGLAVHADPVHLEIPSFVAVPAVLVFNPVP